MQSQKKHRKPKVERVDAKTFAIGYAASAGGKSSAESKAQGMAKAALTSTPPNTKLANFWTNVAGHIAKFAQ